MGLEEYHIITPQKRKRKTKGPSESNNKLREFWTRLQIVSLKMRFNSHMHACQYIYIIKYVEEWKIPFYIFSFKNILIGRGCGSRGSPC